MAIETDAVVRADAVVAPVIGVPAVVEPAPSAAPVAATTRASRRIRTAQTPIAAESAEIITDAPAPAPDAAGSEQSEPAADTDLPAEPLVPAAAIAWAAAAAAAVDPKPVVPVEPVLAAAEPFVLLESTDVVEEEVTEFEPTAEPEPVASDIDEFEFAARVFSFTGETPVQTSPASDAAQDAASVDDVDSAEAPHVAPTRRRARMLGRQITTASFSIGVMGIVGLLAVGMTTPAEAVAAVNGTESTSLLATGDVAAEVDPEDIQAYVAPVDIENAALDRDENYASVSLGELASEQGISNYSNFFVNDPNAAIQWPFAVGVPITFGFGMRSGRMHEGADFVPGQGADVQAIADGTVRIATNSGGAYGVTVVIDHVIDGQLVSSRYAHMLYGSLKVAVGQQVGVGTILGNTGNTGRSYGAHTHFEILQGGTTAVDPIAWLREYTGRASLEHW